MASITDRLDEPTTLSADVLQAVYDGHRGAVAKVYARALHDRSYVGWEVVRLAVADELGPEAFTVVDALAAGDDRRSLRTVGELADVAHAALAAAA